MLEITNIRDGAVLDHNDGIETPDYLEITVEGIATSQAEVLVNGRHADRCDRLFTAKVRLTQKVNTITALADDAFGVVTQTITVIWDKQSFKRYNFFFDDCSFFLRSIGTTRPKSIFDEMFLGRLKAIHEKYGTKFTLNLFGHDDHHDYFITDFPEDYKAEFKANSDWLKMSFHAKSEFPDRPYQNATAETLAEDYDFIYGQVCRFAGKECFMRPLVIHWGMTNPDNFKVLRERGVKLLTGGFLDCATRIGETHACSVTDIGYHYEKDYAIYLRDKRRIYDRHQDMLLMTNMVCCNLCPQDRIHQKFQELAANPCDTISLMSHEQYSYPDYFNYLPDHLDRIELACRLITEAGYKPVYFAEHLAGNDAWDK